MSTRLPFAAGNSSRHRIILLSSSLGPGNRLRVLVEYHAAHSIPLTPSGLTRDGNETTTAERTAIVIRSISKYIYISINTTSDEL